MFRSSSLNVYISMGGRKFSLSVRKHAEPKKPPSLIVSIKRSRVSLLTVSLPRELYMSCPVDTLPALTARLEVQLLPPQWFLSSADSSLSLFKVDRQQPCSSTKVAISIQVDEHRQWSLAICGKVLAPASSATFAQIPQVLGSMPCVFQLLNLLEST